MLADAYSPLSRKRTKIQTWL